MVNIKHLTPALKDTFLHLSPSYNLRKEEIVLSNHFKGFSSLSIDATMSEPSTTFSVQILTVHAGIIINVLVIYIQSRK